MGACAGVGHINLQMAPWAPKVTCPFALSDARSSYHAIGPDLHELGGAHCMTADGRWLAMSARTVGADPTQ